MFSSCAFESCLQPLLCFVVVQVCACAPAPANALPRLFFQSSLPCGSFAAGVKAPRSLSSRPGVSPFEGDEERVERLPAASGRFRPRFRPRRSLLPAAGVNVPRRWREPRASHPAWLDPFRTWGSPSLLMRVDSRIKNLKVKREPNFKK